MRERGEGRGEANWKVRAAPDVAVVVLRGRRRQNRWEQGKDTYIEEGEQEMGQINLIRFIYIKFLSK